MSEKNSDLLRAAFDLNFTYTRTYGPVLAKFFGALKNKKILGIKTKTGRVLCPPQEYDPDTAEDLHEWVELASEATLENWCWVHEPLAKHPLSEPFAWGMLRVVGADSLLLHAVRVNNCEQLQRGLKLQPVWSDEPQGRIRDILYFSPIYN